MDSIKKALEWCKFAGIKQEGSSEQFSLWKKLMIEEMEETIEAYDNDDRDEQVDGLADLIVVICNWAHMNRLPLIETLTKVNVSNFTKFCASEEMAKETVNAYQTGTHPDKKRQKIKCSYEYIEPFYVIKSDEGKILKSINYVPVKHVEI